VKRRHTSLAFRTIASTLAVALVAVAVAGLVSVRLISRTAVDVGRQVLSDQADVIAGQLTDQGALVGLRKVVEVLNGQEVQVVLIGPRGVLTGDEPARQAAAQAGATAVSEGNPVSRTVRVAGRTELVEARQGRAGGFALVREAEVGNGPSQVFRRNILISLLVGGGVALVVGLLLSGLLARPLRRTAVAARSLRSGRRDVRVPVRGPSEIAEVAGAVNDLADALHRSESRQREFLLSVSHELRTPLTAVRGFAESLSDGVVGGDDVAVVGRTMEQEAHRLERLVDDLMELARLEADDFRLDPAEVDLTELVREAGAVWAQRALQAGVSFRLEGHDVPVPVHTDPRRLRQVIDGLAENALRVLPAGAPLVFAVSGPATVQVRDGGPGLADEDYAVVFERGALHERYRGSRKVGVGGIGLALVHALVTRMDGRISARRGPEGGACFTVELPTPR
jgi:two-component system OmpR family sensor kinase